MPDLQISMEHMEDDRHLFDFFTECAESLLNENMENTEIPKRLKDQISKKSTRKEMLEKYGEKAFLKPNELKFPVIDPSTGKYDCRLIYAARIRAMQYDYNKVAEKAEELYKSENCQKTLDVNISETHSQMDAYELLSTFDLKFDNIIREQEEQNNQTYKELFNKLLKKYDVDSIDDLGEETKKEFFDELDSKWVSDKERTSVGSTYNELFDKVLSKFGVDDLSELNKEQKTKFFQTLDNQWKSEEEKE